MPVTESFKNNFLSLYAIAVADDEVHPNELRFLHEFARQKGISESEIDALLMNPQKVAPNKPEALAEKVEFLFAVAGMVLADGVVEERERNVFRNICQYLGFLDENIDELMEFMLDEVRNGFGLDHVLRIVENNMNA